MEFEVCYHKGNRNILPSSREEPLDSESNVEHNLVLMLYWADAQSTVFKHMKEHATIEFLVAVDKTLPVPSSEVYLQKYTEKREKLAECYMKRF